MILDDDLYSGEIHIWIFVHQFMSIVHHHSAMYCYYIYVTTAHERHTCTIIIH